MALTLEAEQRLTDVGLVEFFDEDRPLWTKIGKEAHDYVKRNFPNGATIRPDDVAGPLLPLLKVNEDLRDCLSKKKLKEKYWYSDFANLILDRTWGEITAPPEEPAP